MGLRLLLDEHVEREVHRRLAKRGHDVAHVNTHPNLGKASRIERSLPPAVSRSAPSSRTTTISSLHESAYHCVLLFENEALSAEQVADVVHNVSRTYPSDELTGLQKVGREWL